MCFSASASFTLGAILVGLGATSVSAARSRREIPFAAIPLLFGLQQIVEGAIWLTLRHGAPILNEWMTQVYALFAFVLWPVYVPLAVWWMEPLGTSRKALLMPAAVGLSVGAYLLFALAAHPVVSRLVGNHLMYEAAPYVVATVTGLYVLSTTASLLLSSHPAVRLFGALALLSFGAAYAVYTLWFVSVWCFFAAALSTVVWLHVARPPPKLALPLTVS